MGFISFLQKRPNREIVTKQNTFEQNVNNLYETTKNQIQAGISKPTASTGKPIENLHGAAKTTTLLSNIGGGSKETGGGGMAQGLKTLSQFTQAATVKNIIDNQQKKIK